MAKISVVPLLISVFIATAASAQETADPTIEDSLTEMRNLHAQILEAVKAIRQTSTSVFTMPKCEFTLSNPGSLQAAPTRKGPNNFYVPLVISNRVPVTPLPWTLRVGPALEKVLTGNVPTAERNQKLAGMVNEWLPGNAIRAYPTQVIDCFFSNLGAQLSQQKALSSSIIVRQNHSEATFRAIAEEPYVELAVRLEAVEQRLKDIENRLVGILAVSRSE
ncbi:hypothetical protein GOB57_22155 [Sinorhizobium meliloti]|nr:hypothetical protein [Sinorhizobium meliloti]